MILWRIAAETRSYRADDLSGGGAALSPGRWNDTGEALLYTAPSIALAVLETAAHLDDAGLPLNRFLVEITVPASTWKAREEVDPSQLDPTWNAIPAGRGSVRHGSDWLRSARSALLCVPSVIVPEERVVLVNPRHPQAAGLRARVVRRFDYQGLFRSG